jgi:hypothetical protein
MTAEKFTSLMERNAELEAKNARLREAACMEGERNLAMDASAALLAENTKLIYENDKLRAKPNLESEMIALANFRSLGDG